MNALDHLAEHAWQTPRDYGGFDPVGDYCILSQTRDSDLLARHNWQTACTELGAEAYDDGRHGGLSQDRPAVYHWRAGHWAVGWVEYLMVRADAPEEIRTKAGEILCGLAAYPILDEDGYSNAEFDAVCGYWERCSVRDRMEYIKDHCKGVSIFAARRAELPQDDNGYLYETLREGL